MGASGELRVFFQTRTLVEFPITIHYFMQDKKIEDE